MARIDGQDRMPPQKRTATLLPCTCDPERRLRRVPREALQRFQGNMKELRDEQYGKLKASMESKGFFAPVFVWAGHPLILDGHQRLNVLDREGWDVEGGIPVVDIEADDEKDAAEKLLLLSSTYGKVDPQGLYEFTETHGVKLTEFTLPDLPDFDLPKFTAEYYDSMPENPGDPDVVPEMPVKPVSQLGDLWLLGDHRVLCGDSTNPEHVEGLMKGQQASLCFTSPPYAQQRDYMEEAREKTQDWDRLMQDVFSLLPMTEDGQVLVNLGIVHKDGEWMPYWDRWIEWMCKAGWRRFGWYVWDQMNGFPGVFGGRCAPSHEFVFHFNRGRPDIQKHVPTKYPGDVSRTGRRGARGWTEGGGIRVTGDFKIPDSVWRIPRLPDRTVAHEAKFPVGLPLQALKTWDSGLVYEPFLGSGTTVIAAEQLQRACYGMEIAPSYVDIAVRRWAQFTGKEAVLEGDGRTFAQLASERGAHA